jgi:hypothetical protein
MPRRIAILLAISCAIAATVAAPRAANACSCFASVSVVWPPMADGELVPVDSGFIIQDLMSYRPEDRYLEVVRLSDPSGTEVPFDLQMFRDSGFCGASYGVFVPKEPLMPGVSYTFGLAPPHVNATSGGATSLPFTFTTEAISAFTPTAQALTARYTYATAQRDACDYFHGGLDAMISGDVASDGPAAWLVVARNLDDAPDARGSVKLISGAEATFWLELPLLDRGAEVELAVYSPRGVKALSKVWEEPERCVDGCQTWPTEIPCAQAVGAGPVDATNGGNGVDGASYCGPTAKKWASPDAAAVSTSPGCGSTPSTPAPLATWLLAALAFIALTRRHRTQDCGPGLR